MVHISGELPWDGTDQVKGKFGADVSIEEAQRAADLCALNCLRAVGTVAPVDSIARIVKLFGMVNVADGFDETAAVINGESDFLLDVLGERGRSARSAMGMVVPANWAVEIDMIVALD